MSDPSIDVVTVKNPWWLLLATGIISTLFGVLLIVRPWKGITALAWLLGIFFLLTGILVIVAALLGGGGSGGIAFGVLSALGGLAILVWPDKTVTIVAVVAAIVLLLRGVVRGILAVTQEQEHAGIHIVGAVISAGIGICILVWPDVTIAVVAIVMGINSLLVGIVEIVGAFQLRGTETTIAVGSA